MTAINRAALRQVYLPWTPGIQPIWNVAAVRGALNQLELGQFSQAALMADNMMRSVRIASCLDTRIQGLVGLPFELEPYEDTPASQQLCEDIGPDWHDMVPPCELYSFLRWFHLMGFAVGEIRWTPGPDKWAARLFVHHPRYVYHIQHTDEWHLMTQAGDVVIEPGNGKWVLWVDGRLGYYGALVRSLALPWLITEYARRDWNRHSERHGMPLVIVKVPSVAPADEKDGFLDDIRSLASETTIMLPQNVDGNGGGFDISLLEAVSRDWEGFERLITSCNVDIAIRILGQNLTTEIQGGSYAAASMHERVLDGILSADATKCSNTLHHQFLNPYCQINYGIEEAAPWPKWQTERPEDEEKRARVIAALLPALESSPNVSRQIDVRQLLEQFGLPLGEEPPEEEQKLGEMYGYHFEYGIATRNEARARIGLPPIAGGDEVPQPLALPSGSGAAPFSQLMLADLEPGQGDIDAAVETGADAATVALEPSLAAGLAAIADAADEAELRGKLVDLYAASDLPKLDAECALGELVATLRGALSVQQQTGVKRETLAEDLSEKGAAYLRERLKLTDDEWRGLQDNAKQRGWWMSQIHQLSMVDDTLRSLDAAIGNGTPFGDWQRDVGPKLKRAWGRGATDAAGRVFNQGARIQLIWTNAMQSSYNAARFDQLNDSRTKNLYPYWEFRAVMDGDTSDTCAALHGTVKPAGDKWWDQHTPPLHHSCRSTFRPLRRSAAEAKPSVVRNPPAVDVTPGFGQSPRASGMDQQLKSRALVDGDPQLVALFKGKLAAQQRMHEEALRKTARKR